MSKIALPTKCEQIGCALWDAHNKTPNSKTMFLRRLGPDPHAGGKKSVGANGCPDIHELTDGDFAVIGIDITREASSKLPPTAGCGPDEKIVRVPRDVLVGARADIPTS